jgi:hypothetical protein
MVIRATLSRFSTSSVSNLCDMACDIFGLQNDAG